MDRTEFTNYRSFRLGIIWFSGPEITNQIFLATTYLAYFKAFGHFLNKFLDFYIKQLFQNIKIFSKQKEAIVNYKFKKCYIKMTLKIEKTMVYAYFHILSASV